MIPLTFLKVNINTGIEPILLECVGDELEHRSISTQTSNISLHQLFKDKMSKWCHFNFYMSRDRRYVTWVQYHGSYGHMVEPKVIKGQSSSKCWLMYLLIRWRIIYSFVLNKKSTMYFSLVQGSSDWPNRPRHRPMVRIFSSLFSQRLEVGLIQEHFQAFQTTFMVFILSTLVSWMR